MTTLLEQVRDLVSERAQPTDVVEKRMFGGICFMVRGKLALSVGRDGSLLVRVAGERSPELQRRPGAQVGEMGGRTMGSSWLVIDADTVADETELRFWVDEALAHNARVAGVG